MTGYIDKTIRDMFWRLWNLNYFGLSSFFEGDKQLGGFLGLRMDLRSHITVVPYSFVSLSNLQKFFIPLFVSVAVWSFGTSIPASTSGFQLWWLKMFSHHSQYFCVTQMALSGMTPPRPNSHCEIKVLDLVHLSGTTPKYKICLRPIPHPPTKFPWTRSSSFRVILVTNIGFWQKCTKYLY